MISFLNDLFVIFGGVYVLNRLLYRFYFPKKPKFLPLQVYWADSPSDPCFKQLIMDDSASRSWFPLIRSRSAGLFKISVNLDDHNRLISPLLTQSRSQSLSGERIFRASLNVMLPRYGKSIYIYNSQDFLNFCEKKANLHSLGVKGGIIEIIRLSLEKHRVFGDVGTGPRADQEVPQKRALVLSDRLLVAECE